MKRFNLSLNVLTCTSMILLVAGIVIGTNVLAEGPVLHDFKMTVESPSNGDEWELGSEQTIEWDDDNHHDAGDHRVIVWLSTNSGRDSVPVDTFPLPNYRPGYGGKEKWTVTGETSNSCRIWLRHLSDDREVRGKGGMSRGSLFKIVPGTSIQLPDYSQKFLKLNKPANALHILVYDINGRLIWKSGAALSLTELQRNVKSGIYILRYDHASEKAAFKINLTK